MVAVNYDWDELEDNIVGEYDDVGATIAEYTTEPHVYGNLICHDRGGLESQYHFDALGSTLALTADDQQVTDSYAYTAFGDMTERTGSSQNPFQYLGKVEYYKDEITEEYFVRRRSLSTERGNWVSSDLLLFRDYLNRYAYVRNRPMSLVDFSGLQGEDIDVVCSCESALAAFLRDRPAEEKMSGGCAGSLLTLGYAQVADMSVLNPLILAQLRRCR